MKEPNTDSYRKLWLDLKDYLAEQSVTVREIVAKDTVRIILTRMEAMERKL